MNKFEIIRNTGSIKVVEADYFRMDAFAKFYKDNSAYGGGDELLYAEEAISCSSDSSMGILSVEKLK